MKGCEDLERRINENLKNNGVGEFPDIWDSSQE